MTSHTRPIWRVANRPFGLLVRPSLEPKTWSMSFTVSLEVPPRTGPLPRTGASIDLLVAVAVVLLVVGALIVKAVR